MKKGLFISILALLAVGACGSKESLPPYPDEDKAMTKDEAEAIRQRVIADWRNERMPLADKIIAGKAQWTPSKSMKDKRADWGYFQVSDIDNHIMKFFVDVYGDKPADGRSLWISLHGGGKTTTDENNGQWEIQQVMYRDAKPAQPVEGVYVSPRAYKEDAEMWFFRGNDGLFRQIIETMVLKYDVNPDKVYLLGYSAGGDGVWRMAPRLADHWAAASMMAGHPGDVRFENLRNLPFMMWVGSKDTAYDRNILVPAASAQIDVLEKGDPEGYIHELHVQKGRPHWMELDDAAAFPWMAKYTRNPYPKKIVWRQENEEKKMPEAFFYWLKVADKYISGRSDDDVKEGIKPSEERKPYLGKQITAEINGNTINLTLCDYDKFTIYLNDKMVDLDKNVVVTFGGKELFNGKVERTLKVMRQSMKERNDPSYCFPAQIIIKK